MKLLMENWRQYLEEVQIDFDPMNVSSIEQHLKLGKDHIIKYTHFLGKKAADSGEEKDIRKATFYWYTFSDKFPEIRDIFAKYIIEANKKQKQNENMLLAVFDSIKDKFNFNLQKSYETERYSNSKDNNRESKEYMKRAIRFQNLHKELEIAYKKKNWDFIKDLYNSLVKENK